MKFLLMVIFLLSLNPTLLILVLIHPHDMLLNEGCHSTTLDPSWTSVRHARMAHQHTEHCHLAVHNLNIFQKTRHKWWNEIEEIDSLVYVHSSGSDDTVDWPWTGYRTVMTCHHRSLCVFLAVMCVITVWTQSQTQFFFSPSLFPPDIWSYATL